LRDSYLKKVVKLVVLIAFPRRLVPIGIIVKILDPRFATWLCIDALCENVASVPALVVRAAGYAGKCSLMLMYSIVTACQKLIGDSVTDKSTIL